MMDRHALHGRNDDSLDVPASIASIVHRRVPAVLRIVFVTMLRASSDIIKMLPIGIDEFDGSAVTVDVDNRPQWATSFDAAKEETLFFPINAEVNVSGGCDVIKENCVRFGEPLG